MARKASEAPADGGERGGGAPRLGRASSGSRLATLVRSESQKHLAMLQTGTHPLDISFSKRVAVTSFAYLGVAYAYASEGWLRFGALFCLVTLFSLLADSVAPKTRWVCTADRFVATVSTLLSPVRVVLVPGVACMQVRVAVFVAMATALATLAYSRASPTLRVWKRRHTLWHGVSAAGLAWLARLSARGLLHTPLLW